MGRLERWWQRLVGRPEPVDSHQSKTRHVTPGDAHKPGTPTTKRPAAPGELTIADDKPAKQKERSGRAGFDPYSSDAGYSKSRGWDRVDHD
jgi:hypothetical protein